jgi:hypothetical protein
MAGAGGQGRAHQPMPAAPAHLSLLWQLPRALHKLLEDDAIRAALVAITKHRHVVALAHKSREIGGHIVLPLHALVVLQDLLLGSREVLHRAGGQQEGLPLAAEHARVGGGVAARGGCREGQQQRRRRGDRRRRQCCCARQEPAARGATRLLLLLLLLALRRRKDGEAAPPAGAGGGGSGQRCRAQRPPC